MSSQTKSSHKAKRDYWQQQIRTWKTSGLTQKQYCRSNSIALSTFCYWKSKISRAEPTAPRFYPLAIPPSLSEPPDAGLMLVVGQKQFKVQIQEKFSPTALKKLIAILETV